MNNNYTYWTLYVVSVLGHRVIKKHCPNCNLIEHFRRGRAMTPCRVHHGPLGLFARRLHDRKPSLKGTRLIPRLSLEDEGSEECAYCSNNITPFCINGFYKTALRKYAHWLVKNRAPFLKELSFLKKTIRLSAPDFYLNNKSVPVINPHRFFRMRSLWSLRNGGS